MPKVFGYDDSHKLLITFIQDTYYWINTYIITIIKPGNDTCATSVSLSCMKKKRVILQ